nr:BREX system ATP-binding domain-containing protein [Nitrosomonas nitrosa]
MTKLTERERTSILKSLAMGGVPLIGLQHLAVAREAETKVLCHDIDSVVEGASAFRIVQGNVGAGKTFVLHLARVEALRRNLVVAHTEFGTNHRLYGRDGSSLAFLAALMSNLFTRTSSEPGALRRVIEIWINEVAEAVRKQGGGDDEIKAEIVQKLRVLKDYENGQAFAHVLAKYYEGFADSKPILQDAAVRWLRGEFSTKTEARELLGVRTIIQDENVYPALKVFALFCRIAGFGGLFVIVDELSALTDRLGNIKARHGNFGALLKLINESIQGGAPGFGFLFSGTDSAVEDEDKGLFSYAPLRSRLKPSAANEEITRFTPIIPLKPLGYEHLYELLRRVTLVHAGGEPERQVLPDNGIQFFVEQHIGSSASTKVANPRDILRPFVELLVKIEENPTKPWQSYFAKAAPVAK